MSLILSDVTIENALSVNGKDFNDVYTTASLSSSTGIIDGGVLSIASSTQFNITSGAGVIYSISGSTVTENKVSWSSFNNITPTYLNTNIVTHLFINGSGDLVQQYTLPTPEQFRNLIYLGRLLHLDQTNISSVINNKIPAYQPMGNIVDFARAIGVINVIGNDISANGSNLSLNKSEGVLMSLGYNYSSTPNNPNDVVVAEQTAFTFTYRFQNGNNLSNTTTINPTIYDVNGVQTTVPANHYTIQRIFVYPSGGIRIQPGQATYNTFAEAKGAIISEPFVIESNNNTDAALRAVLIVKESATNLSDPTHAVIYNANLFGEFNIGTSISSLQNAYDNSATGTITTATNQGSVKIKRGSASDTDNVLEIKNGSDTTTFYVKGNGATSLDTTISNKVDKVSGYDLSKNDFTDQYKSDVDLHQSFLNDQGSAVSISGGTITPTGGVNFSVSAGTGYARNLSGKYDKVSWNTLSGSCTNNGDNFINVDYQGNIVITTSASTGDYIALGYISTALSNTVIVGYSNARLKGDNHLFHIGEWFRSTLGSVVQSGCSTSMQTSPNELKITVSSGYIWTLLNKFTISQTSTFTKLVNSSDAGFFIDSSAPANTVNTTKWNNSSNVAASALVTMTTGYYKKDMIAITPEGSIFYLYGTSEWPTLDEAKTAALPNVPENIKVSVVRSAALIVQEGATSVSQVLDLRPIFSRVFEVGAAASNASVISHTDLVDKDADDHTQYHNDTRGDARYYLKTQVDSALSGKANTSHTHVAADITDLSKSSVGLSNVQDVDQTNASNLTSGTVNNARLTTNLSQIGNLTLNTNDFLQYNGSNIVNITPANVKTSIGLNNVSNNLQVINAGGGVSFASGLLSSRPVASTNGRFFFSTDSGPSFDNGTTWIPVQVGITGDITITANGTTATLPNINSNIGTFNNLTVNAKGQVTSASNVNYLIDSGTNGILSRTTLNTTVARTIQGTTNQITVSNGDGVSADPTILIADNPIMPGTGSMLIPVGTDAQRPAHSNGKVRFNSSRLLEEISETNVWRPFGRVMSFVTGTIPQTTGTTILPYDTTLPTSTEGFQIWSQAITPLYTNSTIVVIFTLSCECSSATAHMTTTLLNGTSVISRASVRQTTANTAESLTLTRAFLAGTTSTITLSARIGPSAASTVYVNRGDTETMGGTITSYIIMELY